MKILNEIGNFFRKYLGRSATPQEIYKARLKKQEEENSDYITDEKLKKDALKSTVKELVEKKKYTLKKALSTIYNLIIIPLKIPLYIYQKVEEEVNGDFEPL